MNSDFLSQVQSASDESQSILGDTFTIAGDNKIYTGVFGNPIVVDIPNVGGGYKRQVQIPLNATRDQFSADPVPKVNLTRTTGAPSTYIVAAVNLHDPFFYFFHLVKIGA